jgi:hypothetical protein
MIRNFGMFFMQVLHFDLVKRRNDTKEGRLFSRKTQVFRLGQAVQMGTRR